MCTEGKRQAPDGNGLHNLEDDRHDYEAISQINGQPTLSLALQWRLWEPWLWKDEIIQND